MKGGGGGGRKGGGGGVLTWWVILRVLLPLSAGITPLFLAARNGNVELVKALVRAKADVNKLGGSQCIGPLHWAAHKEYSEVALFLIEHGGDLLLKDGEGRTPLSMASLVLAEKMIGQGLNAPPHMVGVVVGLLIHSLDAAILHGTVVMTLLHVPLPLRPAHM